MPQEWAPPSVVYFDKRLGAAPLNAGQNQSKTMPNASKCWNFFEIQ